MNWDAIGAVAELLGAIGVIASLVYLATQIRQSRAQMDQNTRAVRASTYQQFRREIYDAWHRYMQAPEYVEIIRTGMADFQRLDEREAFQFTFWVNGLMSGYDNAYYQYRMGLLDQDRWEKELSSFAGLLRNPGVAQWWKAFHPKDSPEFVALVEAILAEEAGGK